MKSNKYKHIFIILILVFKFYNLNSQNIQLYEQYNGRFDYTFIGNTLNKAENGINVPCEILTSSSSILLLYPNEHIHKAYLYWAGSGPGDFDIKLNEIDITAQRRFTAEQNATALPFFAAFSDVTEIVTQAVANNEINFTVSELDLTEYINDYCFNGTNFGGWAILIVYESDSLPLNQLNIYDGLESVPNAININLGTLNVLDTNNSSIGFIAWEGDRNIAVNETLRFNGNILSRAPLNPADNAFNGTNSITGSSRLYNMDLDIYYLDQFLTVGQQAANVSLTSGQDFVLINTVVTKLNSQLPDASILITAIDNECNSREITVHYSITNFNSTQYLPAQTQYRIYANDFLLLEESLSRNIPIGDRIDYVKTLTIPTNLEENFTLKIVVDEEELIPEIIETNNILTQNIIFRTSYDIPDFSPVVVCNLGFYKANLNTNEILAAINDEYLQRTSLHYTLADAEANYNAIIQDVIEVNGRELFLYVRIENESGCITIKPIPIKIKNCLPTIYNAISTNEDGMNDHFIIEGLKDIFEHYVLEIYNRWGVKIWSGNNKNPLWNGDTKSGKAPAGTYFYILYLNDPDHKKPIQGNLYLTY